MPCRAMHALPLRGYNVPEKAWEYNCMHFRNAREIPELTWKESDLPTIPSTWPRGPWIPGYFRLKLTLAPSSMGWEPAARHLCRCIELPVGSSVPWQWQCVRDGGAWCGSVLKGMGKVSYLALSHPPRSIRMIGSRQFPIFLLGPQAPPRSQVKVFPSAQLGLQGWARLVYMPSLEQQKEIWTS